MLREASFYGIPLPDTSARISRTVVHTIHYHSFDNVSSFRKKLEFGISKYEALGWRFLEAREVLLVFMMILK